MSCCSSDGSRPGPARWPLLRRQGPPAGARSAVATVKQGQAVPAAARRGAAVSDCHESPALLPLTELGCHVRDGPRLSRDHQQGGECIFCIFLAWSADFAYFAYFFAYFP